MVPLYQTVVVKKQLSRRAKLSIYQSVYVLTPASGHELWVLTERTRSRVQVAKIRFLWRAAVLSLRDRVRNPDIWRQGGVEMARASDQDAYRIPPLRHVCLGGSRKLNTHIIRFI